MEVAKHQMVPKERIKSISTKEGNFVTWTADYTPSILYQPVTPYPAIRKCANCSNPHRYCCSVSKLPVCSLECYRVVETKE